MTRTWASRVAVAALVGVFLLITAAAAVAVKPKAGRWTGTTSQTLPITSPALTFQVAKEGTSMSVLNFEPVFEGSCTKAGSPSITSPIITTDAGRNIPISKKRKFFAEAKNGRLHSDSTTVGTSKDQVHGTFTSKKKASGTYSVTFQFDDSSVSRQFGVAGYSCKTGIVTWSGTFS